MSYFLDTQETSQRFGDQVAEFCSLLDTDHVRHGSPEDLFEFAKTLENSNQFRLDLSALVKSVVKKTNDEILLTDMISIIAASVGGPSIAETNTDISQPTNTLMEFLLGTGCWRQFSSPSPPTSPRTTPSFRPAVRAEQPRTPRISAAAPVPVAREKSEDQASLLEVSSELRQTLSRLELNTLEVKHHLDSIEQRISRIAPPSADLSIQTPPPEPILHPNTAHTVVDEVPQLATPAIPPAEVELPARGRAVFSHEPVPEQSPTDDFTSPTFAYATARRRNIIPVGVFLVLLAIIAAPFFFLHLGQREALLKAGMSSLKTVRTLFDKVPAAIHRTPAASVPPAAVPASAPAASVPAPSSPTTPPAPPATAKGMTGTAETPSTTSDSANRNISPDTQPSPGNPKIRYIPANVMEGHLVSAPKPEYPTRARINHIEGQVTLQAVISKAGSVKALHVIKGSEPLRNAAIDAVYNWRYKPYLMDGRPTEIVTTVYVDFSLQPPPAIVH